MDDVVTLVLAGGVGSRLLPLTANRAKPAVPFGGHYRIIDFTLSNCLHSGLRRVLVLPQYKSHSLLKHLRDGWSIFNPSLGEYITPVPPQMRTDQSWYQGTADAIYQNLYLLERSGAKYVAVLSGDHVYRMDYAEMIHCHKFAEADVTVACLPVATSEAHSFGVLSVNDSLRITDFHEKPNNPLAIPGKPGFSLVSMGVYVFSINVLIQALRRDSGASQSSRDLGHDVLPELIRDNDVLAYEFGTDRGRVTADGYWRDVGSIDAFYQANMDLLSRTPPLDLYQSDWQIRTASTPRPPARTCTGSDGAEPRLINSILSPGVVVEGGVVVDSILSPDVRVYSDSLVVESILFEGVEVQEGARLSNCIVEKGVSIPPDTIINADTAGPLRSEKGVIVIPGGYTDWDRHSSRHQEPSHRCVSQLNRV